MPGLHKSSFPMGSHCCPFENPMSHKSSADFLPQSGFTEMKDLSCLNHSQCWRVLSLLTGLCVQLGDTCIDHCCHAQIMENAYRPLPVSAF